MPVNIPKKKPAAVPTTTATLIVVPSVTTVGNQVRIEGCGYTWPDGKWMPPVQLDIIHPDGVIESYGLGLFFNGCISGTYFIPTKVGVYTLKAVQNNIVVATTLVTVS